MSSLLSHRRYHVPEPTAAESWFRSFKQVVSDCDRWPGSDGARGLAFEWARGVSKAVRLRSWTGWKQFKRAVAARWFGEPERHIFLPEWQVDDVISYASTFGGRTLRASLFAPEIACHAQSTRLPPDPEMQKHSLGLMDRSLVLEVFPESSSATGICFRRCGDCFGADVTYEAGLGQAMYVFESEQGEHSFVSVSQRDGLRFVWKQVAGQKGTNQDTVIIQNRLEGLMRRRGWELQAKVFGLCRGLGIEWVAVEGYYDPEEGHRVTVVDVDLPFDVLFMCET